MPQFTTYEPAWLDAPPDKAEVAAHDAKRGGRWLCSLTLTSPVFFDLHVSDGRVVLRHAGTKLSDVLSDGDNVARFEGARWARVTLAGVPFVEVNT